MFAIRKGLKFAISLLPQIPEEEKEFKVLENTEIPNVKLLKDVESLKNQVFERELEIERLRRILSKTKISLKESSELVKQKDVRIEKLERKQKKKILELENKLLDRKELRERVCENGEEVQVVRKQSPGIRRIFELTKLIDQREKELETEINQKLGSLLNKSDLPENHT